MPTSRGNARAYGPGRAWIETASAATPMTSATYTGLGASSTQAAAAMAQTSQTPACQVGRVVVVPPRAAVEEGDVGAAVCVVLVTSVGFFLDSDGGSR